MKAITPTPAELGTVFGAAALIFALEPETWPVFASWCQHNGYHFADHPDLVRACAPSLVQDARDISRRLGWPRKPAS
jgi:hypothetical protein